MSEREILRKQAAETARTLRKARCWSDRSSCGTRATKWLHLSQYDVDKAADLLDRCAAQLCANEQEYPQP